MRLYISKYALNMAIWNQHVVPLSLKLQRRDLTKHVRWIFLRKYTAWKVSLFGVILVRWTEYEEIIQISPYSVQMQENMDQNNSEYRYFLWSDNWWLITVNVCYKTSPPWIFDMALSTVLIYKNVRTRWKIPHWLNLNDGVTHQSCSKNSQ